MPKISVIIPIYNSESTLSKSIDSVFSQSFLDWELILVNDGSLDRSDNVAKSFLVDQKVFYIYQENKGVSSARNLGASLAKGDWLIFLDSDDLLLSNALEDLNELVSKSNNHISAIFAGYVRRKVSTGEMIEFIPKSKDYSKLSGAFMINTFLFMELGGYDEMIKFGENTELFHRFHFGNHSFEFLNKVILIYQDHDWGGSKNLLNSTYSIQYVLNKHSKTLSPRIKFLYHQILGVNHIRLRKFKEAKFHFNQALSFNKTSLSTYLRYFISFFPFVAKKLYPEKVKYK